MDRVEDEATWLFCPGVADVFVWGEGLQVLSVTFPITSMRRPLSRAVVWRWFMVPIIINSQGLHGQKLSTTSESHLSRVLLSGDSVAFSQGMAEGETLADQLVDRLNR